MRIADPVAMTIDFTFKYMQVLSCSTRTGCGGGNRIHPCRSNSVNIASAERTFHRPLAARHCQCTRSASAKLERPARWWVGSIAWGASSRPECRLPEGRPAVTPSPALTGTLSPWLGEREWVRGCGLLFWRRAGIARIIRTAGTTRTARAAVATVSLWTQLIS